MANILLIEPDVRLSVLYRSALERTGHAVSVARHAQDAVHTADDMAPDLVVLELQLRQHNGIEFLHEFRSYPEWQNVPVVLLTLVQPASLRITKAMMQQFGIVDCLYKPATSLVQLQACVANALQQKVA